MATKQEVLKLLENNDNHYFSGEEIAKKLNVSRAAVWKAIKSLQKEGYSIDAISNKGYALKEESDVLSKEGILKYLEVECDLEVENIVTSTNTLLVQKAIEGEKEGTILVAGMQTKGKGRTGHSFHSPKDTGVYLSILLRPTTRTPMEATNITSMAAVSACEAIEKVTNENPQIKWVNDVFVDMKKVCGILTEASISMESKLMEYVVMGIGLNAYIPEGGFPEDIKDIAGPIFKQKENEGRNKLAAAFINSFMNYYNNWDKKEYYDAYKNKSMILNKEIYVVTPEGNKTVFAKDIDENFELVVDDHGVERVLSSGEVHIKL